MTFTRATGSLAHQQLSVYRRDPSMVLQMLRNLQLEQNCITETDIAILADGLNTPRTKVQALIDFYSFLHNTPRGRYDIYFSDSITDHMLGSLESAKLLCNLLGVELGVPRNDGAVTVSMTSCTGLCERGPAVLVNGRAIDRVDEVRTREIAHLVEAGVPIHEWPLAWFFIRDALRKKGPLLDRALTPGTAIQRTIEMGAAGVIDALEASGLRGCGGAGFATHRKWDICRSASADQRFVICNADEGEPGTFKDRALLNSYTDTLIEGMTVCGLTIGAARGFIYLRHEYEFLRQQLQLRLKRRRETNLLGNSILGHHGIKFDIDIYMGAGSYVCGEESALIESLEGKRGIPRIRPPFPVNHGYRGRPTVVNNVETLCYAARIIEHGQDYLAHAGDEPGWKILSISGDCRYPGIFEIPLGTTIAKICTMCGAENTRAIQVGGPGGILVTPDEFDRKLSFDDCNSGGSFIIFDDTRNMVDVAVNFTHFFAHESCGFCTPCRVGTKLLVQLADKIAAGHGALVDIDQMQRLHRVMTQAAHCGLGQRAAVPLLRSYEKCRPCFAERMSDVEYTPAFDVEAAIERSRQIVAEEGRPR